MQSRPLPTLDPLIPDTDKPADTTAATDATLGQDVARLMSPMPEASRQYRETGRDLAVQRAMARWPLLLEIQHGTDRS